MSDTDEPSQVDASLNNEDHEKEEDGVAPSAGSPNSNSSKDVFDLEAQKKSSGSELVVLPTRSPLQVNLSSSIRENNSDLIPFFTCPLTKQIFQDPVVLQDGISYERQAVVERNKDDKELMYPNRALETILAECMASSGAISPSAAATSTNTNNNGTGSTESSNVVSTSTLISKPSLLQQAKRFFAAQEDRPLPDAFYCPITLGLMHKPVIDPQGYTYERVAIYKWIEVNGDSPVTRAPLTVEQLVPNHALEGLLQAEANQENAEDIHPAIVKWKKESLTMVFDIPVLPSPGSSNNLAASDSADAADAARAFVPFATTPEELQMQVAEARRTRRKIRLCRLSVIVLLIGLVVVGFFVPILAAILVVVLIFGIWCALSGSTRSNTF